MEVLEAEITLPNEVLATLKEGRWYRLSAHIQKHEDGYFMLLQSVVEESNNESHRDAKNMERWKETDS